MKISKREYLLAKQTFSAFFIAHKAGFVRKPTSRSLWADYTDGNGNSISGAMIRVLMRCKRIIKKYEAQNK